MVSLVAVAAGDPGTLMLDELGRISIWRNHKLHFVVGIKDKVVQIAAGRNHGAILTEKGEVLIGNFFDLMSLQGSMVVASDWLEAKRGIRGKVCQVGCQQESTVALTKEGKVWEWNEPASMLGNHEGDYSISVRRVKQVGEDIVQIAVGGWHSLGLDKNGIVWRWGNNKEGQTEPEVAEQIAGRVVQVAAGRWHSLALTDRGEVWTWGSNLFGQLGRPFADERSGAQRVTKLTGKQIIKIAAGEFSCLCLEEKGEDGLIKKPFKKTPPLWGWGSFLGKHGDFGKSGKYRGAQISWVPLELQEAERFIGYFFGPGGRVTELHEMEEIERCRIAGEMAL